MKMHLRFLALAAILFSLTARGDESRTGDGRVVENPTSNGDLKLRVNVGGTKQDALTILGASGRPTFKTPSGNGMIFNLDTTTAPSSAAAQNTLQFLQGGSIKAYIGTAGLANGLINGDLASDLSIVSSAGNMNFSTDNGTSRAGQITTTGGWIVPKLAFSSQTVGSGTTNDLTLTGNFLRFTAGGTLTGVVPILGSQIVIITGFNGSNVLIQNENAGSAAANRILTGTAADITITNEGGVAMIYDSTSNRWRVFAAQL